MSATAVRFRVAVIAAALSVAAICAQVPDRALAQSTPPPIAAGEPTPHRAGGAWTKPSDVDDPDATTRTIAVGTAGLTSAKRGTRHVPVGLNGVRAPHRKEELELNNGRFENKAERQKSQDNRISFAASTADAVVAKFESGGRTFSIGRPNSSGLERQGKPKKSKRGTKNGEDADEADDRTGEKNKSNGVKFDGVFGSGTDLRYEAATDGLKETITLSAAPNKPVVFRFPISSPGLTPKPAGDGGFEFVDSNGAMVFRIPAAVMWDSRSPNAPVELAAQKVQQELVRDDDGYVLILSPSFEWLKAADRVYPVTIDPTVTVNAQLSSIGTWSNGATYGMSGVFIGTSSGIGMRSFAKFDPNGFDGQNIVKATLKLSQVDCTAPLPATFGVRTLTSAFSQQTTSWTSIPTWTNEISTTTNVQSGFVNVDITAAARAWAADPTKNFGLMFYMNSTSGYCWFNLWDQYSAPLSYVDVETQYDPPSIKVTPSSVVPGKPFTVSWRNAPNSAGSYYAQLARPGDPLSTNLGATSPTQGTFGSGTLQAPQDLGRYVVRLMDATGLPVAESAPFFVAVSGPTILLSWSRALPAWYPFPAQLYGLEPTKTYKVTIEPVGSAANSAVVSQNVPSNTSSTTVMFTMPSFEGFFVFRVYETGNPTVLAQSDQIQLSWSFGTPQTGGGTTIPGSGPAKATGSIPTLISNDNLWGNSFLESDQGHLRLYMQQNGDVVVKRWTANTPGWTGLDVWRLSDQIGTAALVPWSHLQMHPSGDLILWPPSGSAIWHSGTYGWDNYRLQLRLWDTGYGTTDWYPTNPNGLMRIQQPAWETAALFQWNVTFGSITAPPPPTPTTIVVVQPNPPAGAHLFQDYVPTKLEGSTDIGCITRVGDSLAYSPFGASCVPIVPVRPNGSSWELWVPDAGGVYNSCLRVTDQNTLGLSKTCDSDSLFSDSIRDGVSFAVQSAQTGACLKFPELTFVACDTNSPSRFSQRWYDNDASSALSGLWDGVKGTLQCAVNLPYCSLKAGYDAGQLYMSASSALLNKSLVSLCMNYRFATGQAWATCQSDIATEQWVTQVGAEPAKAVADSCLQNTWRCAGYVAGSYISGVVLANGVSILRVRVRALTPPIRGTPILDNVEVLDVIIDSRGTVVPSSYAPYVIHVDPITGSGPMAIDTGGWAGSPGVTKTLNGGFRSNVRFWKEWVLKYPSTISTANKALIDSGLSPLVDTVWENNFPETGPNMGEKLEHHHVGCGPIAIPLPWTIHRGKGNYAFWHDMC